MISRFITPLAAVLFRLINRGHLNIVVSITLCLLLWMAIVLTNHLESWHCKLKKELNRPHPNLFRAIQLFKDRQWETEHHLRLLRAGGAPPAQRRKYTLATQRLVRLKQRLLDHDITPYQYAGAVGGTMTFNF